jgi:DNA-binding NarL/FixJ family response regulator
MKDLHAKPTVVLADDHAGMLDMELQILGIELDVLASVKDGAQAVQAVTQFKPDVVILDIGIPVMDGMHAAFQMRQLGLPTKVVFLTVQEDPQYLQAATELGACYVVKSRMHSDLLVAVKELLAGRPFVSPPSVNRDPHR